MPSPPGSNGCFRRQYSCLPSLLGAVIVFKPENIGLLALEALPSLLALETLFAPDGRPAVPPEICDLVLRLGIDIACHVATLRSTLATRDAAEQARVLGSSPRPYASVSPHLVTGATVVAGIGWPLPAEGTLERLLVNDGVGSQSVCTTNRRADGVRIGRFRVYRAMHLLPRVVKRRHFLNFARKR
jgi:hypothetical protein